MKNLYKLGCCDGVGAESDNAAEADKLIAQMKANYERLLSDNKKSWTDSAATNSVKGSIERLGSNIDRWATVLRSYAEAGRKPSGSKYTWIDWRKYGEEDLNSAMRAQGNYAIDASQWNAIKLATAETVDDVKQGAIAVKQALPSSNALVVGGLIAVGVLGYVALRKLG